jgi:plasmid stability protein
MSYWNVGAERLDGRPLWRIDDGDHITLADELVAGLKDRAQRQRLSVEQLAIGILTQALEEPQVPTPLELVERIQATPRDPSQIIPARSNLADALRSTSGDSALDLEAWKQEWAAVEGEMKAVTRANDVAEGRGG